MNRILRGALGVVFSLACVFAQAPLQSTLTGLTCTTYVQFAQNNMPKPPAVDAATVSANPAVFIGDGMAIGGYIYKLNRTQYIGQLYGGGIDGHLNGINPQLLNAFSGACHEWEQHKDNGPLPPLPRFQVFDTAAFDQWWTMFAATVTQGSDIYGQNPPPLFFYKMAPMLPAVQILAESQKPAPAVLATDSVCPIGTMVAARMYNSTGIADVYPDGFICSGDTGTYQKHIYNNPFTMDQTRIIWIQLAAAPLPAAK